MSVKTTVNSVKELFEAGAHFGFLKSRRHPSTKSFIYGSKNTVDIFNLEKTSKELDKAAAYLEEKGREAATVIFVGGKSEAREAVRNAGLSLGMPFVDGRWIGGTLTNFSEIKRRLSKLEELTGQRERGELAKYTKKERLLIDRDIEKLTIYFGGITGLRSLPKLLVIVDPKREYNALAEAHKLNIPVVALAGSDSNLYKLDYAIPANDSSRQSIALVLSKLVEAYRKGASEREKTESISK